MNQRQAKQYGIDNGMAAGKYCEVDDTDRREASDCECEAPNVCEDCLTQAAYESESNARQYTPFEFFASDCNKAGDRSEGLWEAYDEGVGIGIKRAVKERLQRYAEAARELQATVNDTKARLKTGEVVSLTKVGDIAKTEDEPEDHSGFNLRDVVSPIQLLRELANHNR